MILTDLLDTPMHSNSWLVCSAIGARYASFMGDPATGGPSPLRIDVTHVKEICFAPTIYLGKGLSRAGFPSGTDVRAPFMTIARNV